MGQLRAMKKVSKGNTAQRIKTAEEAHKEGLRNGYLLGVQDMKKGVADAMELFVEGLLSLDQVKDIGPKRYQAILKHLGYASKEELKG